MSDIEDAGLDNEQEQEQSKQPQADPKEIARILADELVQRAQPAQQAQTRRESKVQQTIERYLSKGVSKEGIETLLDILRARDEDRDAEIQERAIQHANQQFNDALYASAEDALEEFADKLPNFKTAQPGLVKRMSEIMSRDPEFEPARQLMERGRVPGARHFQKAADKVIDEFAGGVIKKKAPLEIRSNTKAKPTEDADPISGLDADERKFYFAVKNALGEKAALDAIRKAKAAR